MAKKRNITKEEIAIHKEAVKLRKLNDKELVERCRGAAGAKKAADKDLESKRIKTFVDTLIDGKCAGVGEKTAEKISAYAIAAGFIKEACK